MYVSTCLVKMSADLCWQIIRNNHAYLLKKRNVYKSFSTEPNNLKNVNSLRYNGFCRRKVLGVDPAPGGKGVVLTYKVPKYKRKPAKSLIRTQLKGGPRRALNSIRRFVKNGNYRKDLKKAALRRASAIFKSQRAQPYRKMRRTNRKAVRDTE
ncbi:60S ribosomal protein L28 [Halocaridina rubra]|uniref:Large ribosomal subunit protein eL28 n=1 Tax=Halocaridina rubra TaxID=373956 RepID=A0AAN8XQU8_HALRR